MIFHDSEIDIYHINMYQFVYLDNKVLLINF